MEQLAGRRGRSAIIGRHVGGNRFDADPPARPPEGRRPVTDLGVEPKVDSGRLARSACRPARVVSFGPASECGASLPKRFPSRCSPRARSWRAAPSRARKASSRGLLQRTGRRELPDRRLRLHARGVSFDPALPMTKPTSRPPTQCSPTPARSTCGASRGSSTSSCRSPGFPERRRFREVRSNARSTDSPTPWFRLSVNLYGAPALPLWEFASYQQDLIVGASLQVTVPVGQYDDPSS